MSTNKHAQIRYQALDRCFANHGREYFIDDLIEACEMALQDYTGSATSISRRQVFEDIRYMKSDQGWSIPLENHNDGKRVYYRYSDPEFSINKRPLNESEADQLKEALLTLSRFKGMPQFQWVDELTARLEAGFGLKQGAAQIIEFEENPYLRGAEHITTLFHAILGKQVVDVTYQGFKQTEPITSRFHPHYLKQYNNRWFVLGITEGHQNTTVLSLDRLVRLTPAKAKYAPSTVDHTEYFEDVIGVSVPETPTTTVEIRVAPKLWPYIETKPLHGSQKVIARNTEGVTIRLVVKPNFELQAVLLSHGQELEVLAPADLRKTLHERVQEMARNYGS